MEHIVSILSNMMNHNLYNTFTCSICNKDKTIDNYCYDDTPYIQYCDECHNTCIGKLKNIKKNNHENTHIDCNK